MTANRDLGIGAVVAVALHVAAFAVLPSAPAAPSMSANDVATVVVLATARPPAQPEAARVMPIAEPAAVRELELDPSTVETPAVDLLPARDVEVPSDPTPPPPIDTPTPDELTPDAPAPLVDVAPIPVDVRAPDDDAPAEAAAVRTAPVAIRNDPPVYPRLARRRGIEGTVELSVHVLADGSCGAVTVRRSSGHDALDQAALRAARGWRFEPAREDGVAIDRWIEVPVEFDLDDAERSSP